MRLPLCAAPLSGSAPPQAATGALHEAEVRVFRQKAVHEESTTVVKGLEQRRRIHWQPARYYVSEAEKRGRLFQW